LGHRVERLFPGHALVVDFGVEQAVVEIERFRQGSAL
jgi:hypothetical protein